MERRGGRMFGNRIPDTRFIILEKTLVSMLKGIYTKQTSKQKTKVKTKSKSKSNEKIKTLAKSEKR